MLFRRQQGNSIDPLELGGGARGVPGILQVIREGNVAVTNAPGSGLVESPIFMAFMPQICQALLNTDLKMPGVASWWSGQPKSMELILDRIDELRLIPAFRQRTVKGALGQTAKRWVIKGLQTDQLSRTERIQLVKNNPGDWVGRERVSRSSAAVWENGQLRPGYISMRTFLTAAGDDWQTLPGGLVRVSESVFESSRNPFTDGGAKDAWVLADKPVTPTSLLIQSGEAMEISRSKGSLPSRIADNLCWLGRYLERAGASARLLRSVVVKLTSEASPEESKALPILVRALTLSGQIDPGYAIKEFSNLLPRLETSLPAHALDPHEVNSIHWQVNQIVSLSGTLRDRLSADAWRIVQQMRDNFECSVTGQCDLVDLLDITDTLIVSLAAFSGFVSEFMTRTHAFCFLNIGRRLEHSLQFASLIKNCLHRQEKVSGELLEELLDISDSGLTYRSRYYANLQLGPVLDLLLLDEMNPRSLGHQIVQLLLNLESLPGNSNEAPLSEERELALQVHRAIYSSDAADLTQLDSGGNRPALDKLLEMIEEKLPAISTSISNRFLVHSGPVQQMIEE